MKAMMRMQKKIDDSNIIIIIPNIINTYQKQRITTGTIRPSYYDLWYKAY